MKRSLVISAALSLALLLCACAGGVPEESPLAAVFPDQTSQLEASRFDCGGMVTWDLTGEESASLERWALALDLTAESFPEGETPGDRDGGSGYTFQLGGQSFSYILTGADNYVLLGDTWYRVENPSDPPLSVPGVPELTAAMDKAMLDVKAWDPDIHRRLTGQGNEAVLKNLDDLLKLGKLYEVRTVVIPDYLDNEETVRQVSRKLTAFSGVRYKLIKYRPWGVRPPMKVQSPTEGYMKDLMALAYENGAPEVVIT